MGSDREQATVKRLVVKRTEAETILRVGARLGAHRPGDDVTGDEQRLQIQAAHAAR